MPAPTHSARAPPPTVLADAAPSALLALDPFPTVLADARHHHISLSHATFANTFKSRTSLMVARGAAPLINTDGSGALNTTGAQRVISTFKIIDTLNTTQRPLDK